MIDVLALRARLRERCVHPVTKAVAMRANSLDVISLPTFFCARYKIVAGNTNERMEQHTPPT